MPADIDKAPRVAPLRVLIIDDHTLFRSGLEELLDRRGIDVVATAGDGEEGCTLAEQLVPDVILLDVRMPGMGGLTVLDRLKDAGVTTPVLMLTTARALASSSAHSSRSEHSMMEHSSPTIFCASWVCCGPQSRRGVIFISLIRVVRACHFGAGHILAGQGGTAMIATTGSDAVVSLGSR